MVVVYLQTGKFSWPVLDVHLAKTDANGTGRDDDDTMAIFDEAVSGFDKNGQVGENWLVGGLIDDGTRP